MKKLLIAALIANAANADTPMPQEGYDISPVGVVAYSVLSKIELAKSESFKIDKAIEIAKMTEKLELITSKLAEINSVIGKRISGKKNENLSPLPIKEARLITSKLSETSSWAVSIASEARNGAFSDNYGKQLNLLEGEILEAKELREQMERHILIPSTTSKAEKNKELKEEIERQKVNQKLLASEASELRKLIEGKLLIGAFEHELYYVTAEHELTKDQHELVNRIFDVISQQPDIKVEVIGRADPRGNRSYNEALAESRAKEVASIAERSGIDMSRISVKSHVTEAKIQENRELHFFDRNTSVKVWREK